jgi:hypothetical protein
MTPHTDSTALNSISNILVAFNFQQNLFPIYAALEDKSPRGSTKAVTSGLTVTFSLYITMGILSIFLFGQAIESSVMTNVNNDEHNSAASYILRVCFAIVLACHIPFLFFSGKEAVLIIVDEYQRESISRALIGKLADQSEYFKSQLETEKGVAYVEGCRSMQNLGSALRNSNMMKSSEQLGNDLTHDNSGNDHSGE